jgi:antitoxin ParD1/3/4
MATMNISLPDALKEWVESRVESGKYSTASDYVRVLVREDMNKAEYVAYVQKAVDEGIATGFVDYDRKSVETRLSLKSKKLAGKTKKHAA